MRILRQTGLTLTVELDALTVTVLSDGETRMPADCLRAPDGSALGADPVAGELRLPVRAFLVRGPGGALLIDAGAAGAWRPGLGRLPEALAEAGVGAGEVTAIALTHPHVDHVAGLVDAEGGAAFPNAARVFVAVEDLMAVRADPRLLPILSLLVPMEQGDGPLPGVTAIGAPGHTAGHMAYLVEGRLMIWGDLVHNVAVQFPRPEIGWCHDDDPATAHASRLALMEQAAEAGWLVAGAHLPDPGIGRIERQGRGYAFHPVTQA